MAQSWSWGSQIAKKKVLIILAYVFYGSALSEFLRIAKANHIKSFIRGHFMCLSYGEGCGNYLIIFKKLGYSFLLACHPLLCLPPLIPQLYGKNAMKQVVCETCTSEHSKFT